MVRISCTEWLYEIMVPLKLKNKYFVFYNPPIANCLPLQAITSTDKFACSMAISECIDSLLNVYGRFAGSCCWGTGLLRRLWLTLITGLVFKKLVRGGNLLFLLRQALFWLLEWHGLISKFNARFVYHTGSLEGIQMLDSFVPYAMDSSTIFQAPPHAAYFLWSWDKVYHKHGVCFLLYF